MVLVITLIAAACEAMVPVVSMRALDAMIGGDRAGFIAAAIGWVILLVGVPVLSEISDTRETDVRLGIDEDLHGTVAERLFTLPPQAHQRTPPAETLSKLEQSAEQLSTSLSQLLFEMFPVALFGLIAVVVMWGIHPGLTMMMLVLVPIPALVERHALREATRRDGHRIEGFARVYSRLTQLLERLYVVQAAGEERREADRFLRGIRRVHHLLRLGALRDRRTSLAAGSGEILATIAVVVFGGWAVVQGSITPGALIAFLGYVGGLFGPVQQLSGIVSEITASRRALTLLWEMVDAEDPLADRADATRPATWRGAIATREGGRVLGMDGTPLLTLPDLQIQPGERVALVGESGSGKTSFLRALTRFAKTSPSAIQVDGHAVDDMPRITLRQHCALVPQRIELLPGTLRENLCYGLRLEGGKPETDALITAALRAVGLDHTLRRLPQGLATMATEADATFSGGQRQRLALARALLSTAPILLLDEPTSALDPKAERRVLDALRRQTPARTLLVATHRLETVLDMDRVLVFEHGRVVADGPPGMLLRDRTSPLAALFREQGALERTGEVFQQEPVHT
jgi:ATP-binding cassette subfamily B protein